MSGLEIFLDFVKTRQFRMQLFVFSAINCAIVIHLFDMKMMITSKPETTIPV